MLFAVAASPNNSLMAVAIGLKHGSTPLERAAELTCVDGGRALAYIKTDGYVHAHVLAHGAATPLLTGQSSAAQRLVSTGRGVCFTAGAPSGCTAPCPAVALYCAGVTGGILSDTPVQASATGIAPGGFIKAHGDVLYLPCVTPGGAGPNLCIYDPVTNTVQTPCPTTLFLPYGSFRAVGDIMYFAGYMTPSEVDVGGTPFLWGMDPNAPSRRPVI